MRRLFTLFLSVFIFISCSEDATVDMHEYNGEALGTTYMIKYFSDRDIQFEKSLDSILGTINNSMSTYITKSDISRINRGDTAVKVDDHFVKVYNASNKIFKETNGFFDPTVGVLVNAYGFGPGKALNEINDTKLDSLKELVGLNKISINKNGNVQKDHPLIYLDFNAIAKGYTIDVIADYLEGQAVNDFLIELGGELRASGRNLKSGSEWAVGIDNPEAQRTQDSYQAIINLKNAAMATSGNYRKYRTDSLSGRKFVHTINPLSGKAERSNLLSASVIAENCMLADGYATAFMALGLERSKEVLSELKGVEVYIMYSSDNGDMKIYQSPGFEKNLVE